MVCRATIATGFDLHACCNAHQPLPVHGFGKLLPLLCHVLDVFVSGQWLGIDRCMLVKQYCLYVLQEGNLYNTDDGRKALRDIFALNLFENVQVCQKHWDKSRAHLHDIAGCHCVSGFS